MINHLKPHPAYRDTGLPWLGEIPKHWEQRALWSISKVHNERSHPDLPLLSVFLNRGVIRYEEGGGQVHAPSLDLSNYQVVNPGDFVLNNQQAWRGSVGVSRHHGIISPAYIVLELSRLIDSVFANYLVRCPAMVDQYVVASKGVGDIQRQIYWPFLRFVQMPIPPLSEQVAIARFLTYFDRRIQRYVRLKQDLVKLLNEQKLAIIRRAVIRGIDSDAHRKRSGVSWLDDIPVHWSIRKVSSLFRTQGSGTTPNGEGYYGGGVPWVMSGDLNDAQITITKREVTPEALAEIGALRLYPAGALIVAMYGATIGRTGILGVAACTNQACCVLAEPTKDANVTFVQFVLRVARQHFIQQGYGGGQPNINAEIVKSFRIPCPPISEQNEIVLFVERQCMSLDSAIDRAEHGISFLREYRNRLEPQRIGERSGIQRFR